MINYPASWRANPVHIWYNMAMEVNIKAGDIVTHITISDFGLVVDVFEDPCLKTWKRSLKAKVLLPGGVIANMSIDRLMVQERVDENA